MAKVVSKRMAVMVLEVGLELKPCTHADLENLGSDGNTVFHRCLACGRILVSQGDRHWMLRPSLPKV